MAWVTYICNDYAIHPEWQALAVFGLLWAAYAPGWSFAAINGIDDWKAKFAPSGWVTQYIRNGYLAGVVGMQIRWLLFVPAIWLSSNHWENGLAVAFMAGIAYWLGGMVGRAAGITQYSVRIAACFIGGALMLAMVI